MLQMGGGGYVIHHRPQLMGYSTHHILNSLGGIAFTIYHSWGGTCHILHMGWGEHPPHTSEAEEHPTVATDRVGGSIHHIPHTTYYSTYWGNSRHIP
jgi:hypothetical protein